MHKKIPNLTKRLVIKLPHLPSPTRRVVEAHAAVRVHTGLDGARPLDGERDASPVDGEMDKSNTHRPKP